MTCSDCCPKEKIGLDKIILTAVLLIVSDETLLFGTNINNTFIKVKFLTIILLATVLFIRYILLYRNTVNTPFLYSVLLITLVLISSLANSDLRLGVWYKLGLILLSLAFTRKLTLYEFAVCFDKIMYFLSAASLVGFFLFLIGRPYLSFLPTFTNSVGTEFYNCILFFVPKSSALFRNYGLFREPGVFQMFVILALMMQFGVVKTADAKKILVYIATVLTTLSTTGFFALGIIFLIMLFKRRVQNVKSFQLVLCVSAIVLVIAAVVSPDFINQAIVKVFGKLANTSRYTTIARMGSVFINLRIWMDNFWLGAGLTQLSDLFPAYCMQMYGHALVHNTNTLLIQFASHGVFYGFFWCYGYWRLAKRLGENIFEILMYCGIFVIIFIGENLTFSAITYILLFYGVNTIKTKIVLGKSYA